MEGGKPVLDCIGELESGFPFDVAPFGPSSTLSSDRRELMAEGRVVSMSNYE
jgi:hypothetical protein